MTKPAGVIREGLYGIVDAVGIGICAFFVGGKRDEVRNEGGGEC
jgi:hypothetical protein